MKGWDLKIYEDKVGKRRVLAKGNDNYVSLTSSVTWSLNYTTNLAYSLPLVVTQLYSVLFW